MKLFMKTQKLLLKPALRMLTSAWVLPMSITKLKLNNDKTELLVIQAPQ